MKKVSIPVRWRIYGCIGLFLFCLNLNGCGSLVNNEATMESVEEDVQNVYAEDSRLKLVNHETLEYNKDNASSENSFENSYTRMNKVYNEEEIAKFCHAYFDEQRRLCYVLGYSSGILKGGRNYCEENIYQRDDNKHTCRYIYYKSNSMPYVNKG